MFRFSLLLIGISVTSGFYLSYLEWKSGDFVPYQLIATVVDPKGSEFPLDDKYDVNSGADHLLMEARLCNFMWKAFKRSKILHKLQFGCDMHGRQKENAVLGLHFRKDELAYFGVPANNSVLGEEIVRVTSPIPQMFGLKEVSFPRVEEKKSGTEAGRNLCLSTLVVVIWNAIR